MLLQIVVQPEHLQTVTNIYAPPDHPVLKIVPDSFARYCEEFYAQAGSPPVSRSNVWDVYLFILDRFIHMREAGTVSAEQEAEWRVSYEWSRSEQEPRPAMPAQPFFVGDYRYQGPTAANRVGQNSGALETLSHDL